ncbi:hypothetical protein [Jiangella asiatica]|uniref:hypothetical protein n=1 Tax=Jiangella asiatica TaxID=2530372 RepID=UPI0013A5E2B1|nr:hypothetical protein [Jiangella asiatica]
MPKLTFWRLPLALLTILAVLVLTAAQIAAATVDAEAERSRAVDTTQITRCGGDRP